MKFNLKQGILAILLCAGFATVSANYPGNCCLDEKEQRAVEIFLALVDLENPNRPHAGEACRTIAAMLDGMPQYQNICVILVNLKSLPKMKALLELKKAHNLLPMHMREYMDQKGARRLDDLKYQMRLLQQLSFQ